MLCRNAQYDTCIDWWAVGILIYEMLSGVTPFFNFNRHQLNNNIKNKPVQWFKAIKCSPELKDLVEKLLVKDPSARLGSQGGYEEVLSHPWFPQGADRTAIENQIIEAPIIPEIRNRPD